MGTGVVNSTQKISSTGFRVEEPCKCDSQFVVDIRYVDVLCRKCGGLLKSNYQETEWKRK